MANLKELRVRIKSVKNTQQVTKAMKMVAAAKLKKAQDRIVQLRPYASKLQEIIGNVTAVLDVEEIPSKLVEVRPVENILVVVVTSNRGLAGPFNSNILKHTVTFLEENHADDLAAEKVKFMCVGRKGYEYFKARNYPLVGENHDVFTGLDFDKVNALTEQVFDLFLGGEYDKVYLCFNEFKNVMSQIRRADTFLPVSVEANEAPAEETVELNSDYIFEPGREEILEELIPRALKVQMFRAILESNAAEHGARMVAMDTATENAEDLLKDLKLVYNKARQAAITKEILEISAGADALSN
ncbi:ATP synthase F1 subunit gamma [Pontibacter sp. G13]|uniref:ATP synthase F1 subunit gamma n=1 Tax=Pontibacter sp. G13 TaxID=3074898 RepID=UPI00288A7F0E|nr:ATP synthase F1 subunit gamma [Pontibacter sp. G13]WNJ21389.1 ATP synthase F1 subunit gamma [Pontibacter sp. G13]